MTASSPPRGPALFARGGGISPLLALAALLLSILGALDLAAATTAARALQAWPARLAGSLTVAAGGRGVETADAAAARAAEILALTPGLADVRVLDAAPGDALAGRLLGLPDPGPYAEGPPRLLTARLVAGRGHFNTATLEAVLRGLGLNVAVDDHGLWTGPLERAALAAAAAAAGLGLATLGAVAAVAGRIAARRLHRQARRARLLLQLGATDAMLARPIGGGATAATILWASLGAAAAAASAAMVVWAPPVAGRVDAWLAGLGLPAPTPDALDLAAVLVWPAAVAPAAAWAAAAAARATLRKLS